MHVEVLRASRDTRRTLSRLTIFCAISVALHALTLVAYHPRGVSGAPAIGPAAVLQATLSRTATAIAERSDIASSDVLSDVAQSSSNADKEQQARAGTSDGLNLPLPDKWFTAQELDVRAEPLTPVNVDYPDELAGSGIAGRVQVLLFIDERGTVRKIEIARAFPEGVFDQAAIHAWRDVRFSPAMKDGAAVKSQKLLELNYSAL